MTHHPLTHTQKVMRTLVALVFFVIGVIGGFIPILQGWLFIATGILLLKDHVKWARWLMDYIPFHYPKLRHTFVKAEDGLDKILKKFRL